MYIIYKLWWCRTLVAQSRPRGWIIIYKRRALDRSIIVPLTVSTSQVSRFSIIIIIIFQPFSLCSRIISIPRRRSSTRGRRGSCIFFIIRCAQTRVHYEGPEGFVLPVPSSPSVYDAQTLSRGVDYSVREKKNNKQTI